MNRLQRERIGRMLIAYEREKTLREIALTEALAARAAGKRVPANRRYSSTEWRAMRRYFTRGVKPWWMWWNDNEREERND